LGFNLIDPLQLITSHVLSPVGAMTPPMAIRPQPGDAIERLKVQGATGQANPTQVNILRHQMALTPEVRDKINKAL
jgi:hypothetical protein